MLQWNPETFWKATIIELNAASIGLARFHGAGEDGDGNVTTGSSGIKPLSHAEFDKLKEKLSDKAG